MNRFRAFKGVPRIALTLASVLGAWSGVLPAESPIPTRGGSEVHGHLLSDPLSEPKFGPRENVTVELSSLDGRVIGRTQSDASGYYRFAQVPQGEYQVAITQPGMETTHRRVAIVAEAGSHVLDFMLRVDASRQPPTTGSLKVAVFEQTGEGKSRRTDAALVIWKAEERKSLTQADVLSGDFETTLQAGDWSVHATVPGLDSSDTQTVTITAGQTTTQEIVLIGKSAARTAAVVTIAALRRSGQTAAGAAGVAELPTVQFVGANGITPCVVEPLSASELARAGGDDGQSRWQWFQARPATPLTPGAYQVEGSFVDYPPATTTSQAVVANAAADFHLTFRPVDLQGTVAGEVTLQDGEAEAVPATTKSFVNFENLQTGESRSVEVDAQGQYSATMPPGNWWASANTPDYPTSSSNLVVVSAAETQQQDFALHRSTATPDQDIIVRAIVSVQVSAPGKLGKVQPTVVFTSRGRTTEATLRTMTVDEQQALGIDLIDNDRTEWHIATPKTPLVPGVWRATASAEGIEPTMAEKIVRKGTRASFLLPMVETVASQQATLSGTVVNADGQPVSGAVVRVWPDELQSRPLQTKVGGDGTFAFAVPHGSWWLDAAATGLSSSGSALLLVDSDRQQDISLRFANHTAPLVSAIVSVQRIRNEPLQGQPQVQFYVDDQLVAAELRPLPPASDATDGVSGWDMFEAVPVAAQRDQTCRVVASLDGFVASETETQVLRAGATTYYDLTLRPQADNPRYLVQLSGTVYRQDGDQPRQAMADATVTIAALRNDAQTAPAGDPLVVLDGKFQCELLPGAWLLSAVDPDTQRRVSVPLMVGNQRRIEQDIVLDLTPEPPTQHRLTGTISVLSPRPDQPAPQAVFVAREGSTRRNIQATVTPLQTDAGAAIHYYAVATSVDSAEDVQYNLLAQVQRDGYRRAGSGFQQPTEGSETYFRVTLRPVTQPIEPGRLVGCVGMQLLPSPGTIDGRTLPLRNLIINFVNAETHRTFTQDAEDGCFDQHLPPGKWSVTVRGDEIPAWTHPQAIDILEGQVTQQDILVPAPKPLPALPASIEALIAVHRMPGRNAEDTPTVMLQRLDAESHNDGEAQPMAVKKLTPAEAAQLQLRGLPIEQGTWEWFIAVPEAALEAAAYGVQASLSGYNNLAETSPSGRFAVSGVTTRFDLALTPYVPEVFVRVVDPRNEPRPGLTVRLIQEGQGFDAAIKGVTDAAGVFRTMLPGGTGNYQAVVGGDPNIETEPVDLALFERVNHPEAIRVYGKGEMRKTRLAGILVGKTKIRSRTETVVDGVRQEQSTVSFTEVRLANAVLRLTPVEGGGLATTLRMPISPDAEGAFGWEDVPEGRYIVRVVAEGYHAASREVDVTRDNAHAQALTPFKLDPIDSDLENAIRAILTDGWQQLARADSPYKQAQQLDPSCITPDFALALARLHGNRAADASSLLAAAATAGSRINIDGVDMVGSKHVGMRGDNYSLEYHRANELRLYLLMQRRQLTPAIALLEQWAQNDYGQSGSQTAQAMPAAQQTVYLMGVACGVLKEAWASPETEAFPQRFEIIASSIADPFRDAFERGVADAVRQYQERSGVYQQAAAANEQAAEDAKRERANMIATNLAAIDQRMTELNAEASEDQQKAEKRIAEIDNELAPLRRNAGQLERTLRQLDARIQRLQQDLNQLLRQMQAPAIRDHNGLEGMGEGGFGGGGGLRLTMPQRGPGEGEQDFLAEQERRIRTELQRLGREWDTANRQRQGLLPRLTSLENNRQAVIVAFNRTNAQRVSELNALRNQRPRLEAGGNRNSGKPARPSTELQRLQRELNSFETYLTYPQEQRRQEILQMCGQTFH